MGQFCESCAPGYKREPAFGGKFASCVPCQCNNHSEQCDADSGTYIAFVVRGIIELYYNYATSRLAKR